MFDMVAIKLNLHLMAKIDMIFDGGLNLYN